MYSSPYNLNLNTENPTQFYDELNIFTDFVLNTGNKTLSEYIKDYESFIDSNSFPRFKSEEYLMELLMAGTFWNNYHNLFSIDSLFYRPVFNRLYAWRKQFKKAKSSLDNYRAILAYKYLAKKRNKDIPVYQRFEYMNSWLDCTKEFNQEYHRLENWREFIESKNIAYQEKFWKSIEAFSKWFAKEGEIYLGKYTQNWEDFMMDTAKMYQNKENYFFCTRKPNEYHLNMVAAEVMNRSLKPKFNNTKEKILLLPKCMAKSNNCQAKTKGKHLKCNHCTGECKVSDLTNQMNKKGIKTVLIPHSSSFSEYLKPWKDSKDTALIGVACTLNLITGGYEMQKLNIPSQCVFLDFCGCKKHWLSGNATNLNMEQLNKILVNEQSRQKVNSTC